MSRLRCSMVPPTADERKTWTDVLKSTYLTPQNVGIWILIKVGGDLHRHSVSGRNEMSC